MIQDLNSTGAALSGTQNPLTLAIRTGSGETRLLARLKQGDPLAFEEIVGQYERKVYSLARGLTRNDEDAQDAVQDTFLSVFKNIRRFKGDSSLSTWIYRITVNAALMKMRRRRHDDRTVSIDESMPAFDDSGHRVASLPDWHPRADEMLLNTEMGGHLRRAIEALEPEYRTVLVLRDQEGMSNEDVAAVLGLSVAAIKSRLHRARIFVRERIKGYVLSGD
jgi:RNA polymerase sigma-70 factor, ECF subfamily